jgi:hypothetical protein
MYDNEIFFSSAADFSESLKKWKRSVHKYMSCHFFELLGKYVVLEEKRKSEFVRENNKSNEHRLLLVSWYL